MDPIGLLQDTPLVHHTIHKYQSPILDPGRFQFQTAVWVFLWCETSPFHCCAVWGSKTLEVNLTTYLSMWSTRDTQTYCSTAHSQRWWRVTRSHTANWPCWTDNLLLLDRSSTRQAAVLWHSLESADANNCTVHVTLHTPIPTPRLWLLAAAPAAHSMIRCPSL